MGARQVSIIVNATIAGTPRKGQTYKDSGLEPLEIWVKRKEAQGLPFVEGEHVAIRLRIQDSEYAAKLCSTSRNKVVWVSPVIHLKQGDTVNEKQQPMKLAEALDKHGFRKNDKVRLHAEGTVVTLLKHGLVPPDELLPEEVTVPGALLEGNAVQIVINAYERNPENRRRCKELHGTVCCICGFDFRPAYGEIFDGMIHVHHLRPLAEVGVEHPVDPEADLRPVCPNCHAVLHRRVPAYSIEEVQGFLAGRVVRAVQRQ
jgi:hypothetical protein